ncbi:MAG: right-handed parallel beta-helix repeat-containing protein [Chitinophagaceae bacterium]|nr:right-handed parallel beta-helix repeat-containing protein [Chitinophagaceae bacterium]MCA6456402.1 right-handed parallel beta-helix repeat-containing protein [Chitinophagaceae bacterium]MCA6458084.1 right-handed parallel beta-helix repeat-containing protein [Chitinophagaceae bacterium]MCA6463797.1 right-handed parallel beta-helix repeat-containing protein [Chitinophagaceae bacterium]
MLLPVILSAQKAFQKKYQTEMILAENGSVIELPEGTFTLTNTLSLEGKKKITIRGKGMDKTILSFKGQTDGAEGIRVSDGEDIVLEGFTVQDAKGDAIKTMHVTGITFRDVKTEWTGIPGPQNGGYGLYPVQCINVLIDNCMAVGASDAGIYVGQSQDITVKHSKAWHNVAGIEIENSLRAKVYDNEAWENTGGILVFDLPDLVQKKGGDVKVYNNHIHDNNYENFAPKGNIVASVPSGTGVLILATKGVELYQNRIINNQSVSTGIISYFTTMKPLKDQAYDPYPSAIFIHDNIYERRPGLPVSKDPLGRIVGSKYGQDIPHILYDGIRNPKLLDTSGNWIAGQCITIVNNRSQSIVNLDAEHGFKDMARADNLFTCNN